MSVERNAVALAKRPEPVIGGERLEHPESVESAGDRSGPVFEPGSLEGVVEHGEVEARVVGDEYTAIERSEQPAGQLGERGGASATSASLMPWIAVASSGIGHDGRTSELNRPVSKPSRSSSTSASSTISSTSGSVPVVSQSKTA